MEYVWNVDDFKVGTKVIKFRDGTPGVPIDTLGMVCEINLDTIYVEWENGRVGSYFYCNPYIKPVDQIPTELPKEYINCSKCKKPFAYPVTTPKCYECRTPTG